MKKKILFILHLPPPIHGAAMVGRSIQESKIINNYFECDFINLSTSNELSQIGKGGFQKIILLIKIQLTVLKKIFNKNHDLIYLTLAAKGPGFYKDLFVVALLKILNKKIIYHFHNKGVSSYQDRKLHNLLYKFVFKNTKSILLSPYLYSDIKKYVKSKDVYYCPNGIPKAKNISINLIKNSSEPFRFLFLSNMMTEKGVFVLIEACRLLKERAVKFECHFVGAWSDISEANFNKEIKKMNLGKFVFAHGKKYDEKKLYFFNQTDIFISPTYNECFPLVLLEAMQFGLPVISTPEGGIPDIVIDGETGFLVPQKNAIALAEKIELLIKNPELRLKMGEAGKRRFVDFFTLEKFENNMIDILNRAIKE